MNAKDFIKYDLSLVKDYFERILLYGLAFAMAGVLFLIALSGLLGFN